MKSHGSLFSGIGGWSEASDQMEWETLFMCEWDENKQYVLKSLWPNAEIYGDISSTDFSIWRGRIDILTASTPCQPFSLAGKREGSNDVRHLWPETYRAIREIQPPWFVLENVPGLVNWSKGMVFKQIITDLENEGYEVLPFLLPACGVNAPHKRERIWIVAYSSSYAITGQDGQSYQNERTRVAVNEQIGRGQFKAIQHKGLDDLSRLTSNSANSGIEGMRERENGVHGFETVTNSEMPECEFTINSRTGRDGLTNICTEITPDTNKEGYKGNKLNGTFNPGFRTCKPYESTSEFHQTANWSNFPTVSPLRTRDDGFSRDALRLFINENSRGLLTEKEIDTIIQKSLNKWNNETIAAGGDAVVPEVPLQIFKAINEFELTLKTK
jgi:DNA (cytosine-5)-methyltransferase 1